MSFRHFSAVSETVKIIFFEEEKKGDVDELVDLLNGVLTVNSSRKKQTLY